ncbi:MAG: hypothetical protein RIE24_16510 [Silicimonas sp.]
METQAVFSEHVAMLPRAVVVVITKDEQKKKPEQPDPPMTLPFVPVIGLAQFVDVDSYRLGLPTTPHQPSTGMFGSSRSGM